MRGLVEAGLNEAAVGQEAAWCRDQRNVCNDPNPRVGSDDADIVRASQVQHTVEGIDAYLNFGYPTFVYT
jgi:hypothetical protein